MCAAAMTLQTQLVLIGDSRWTPLVGLVFFSTLFLYAIHRIVGLSKVKDFLDMERFATIAKFKGHIFLYAVVAGIGGLYCFWKIDTLLKILLFVPALISLGYVLPIFGKNRRLRDFNHIKIFLIAIVWAWITVVMVGVEAQGWQMSLQSKSIWILALERTLFIFAITLPFDIRDLEVDAQNGVRTIPAQIGAKNAKKLAYFLLLVASLLATFLYATAIYSWAIFCATLLSYLLSGCIIAFSDKTEEDYFFTGLVDGTMLLLFGITYLFVFLF